MRRIPHILNSILQHCGLRNVAVCLLLLWNLEVQVWHWLCANYLNVNWKEDACEDSRAGRGWNPEGEILQTLAACRGGAVCRPALQDVSPPALRWRGKWKRAPPSAPPLQGRAHIRKVESECAGCRRLGQSAERGRERVVSKVGQRYRGNQAWEQHPRLSAELHAGLVRRQACTRHQTNAFVSQCEPFYL